MVFACHCLRRVEKMADRDMNVEEMKKAADFYWEKDFDLEI